VRREPGGGIVRKRVTSWTDPLPDSLRPRIGLSLAYVALYVGLDRISFIEALHGVDITPWNPPAGLTVALLLVGGPAYIPVIAVAALCSSQILPLTPISPAWGVATSLVIACGYAATATFLRQIFGLDLGLRRGRDMSLVIGAAVIGAGAVALPLVTTYAMAGILPWFDLREAVIQYWIGDAIGIVVFTPAFLLLWEYLRHRQERLLSLRWFAVAEAAVQCAAIIGALIVIFGFGNHRYSFELFYRLFLPLVWIAVRHGLPGASAAVFVIQGGLIVSLEFVSSSVDTVRAFQLLMFALATTGLMLGAVVSERHRVARALAESQGRLSAIFNAARDGVLTITRRGVIESANPAVEELFGCPTRLLLGSDVRNLVAAGDLLDVLATTPPQPLRLEIEGRREDGSIFPIEVTGGRFGAPGDERYTLVIRDITLRYQEEARTQQHQSEVAQVSRLATADEMASALAHEINQPLMAITTYARGCLRLLKHAAFDLEIVREGVEQVVMQAERAGDIIGRLRDFVRTGSSRREIVDVKALIETTLSLAKIEITQNAIEVQLRLAPDLPSVAVDRVQMEQVLNNLLRNAIDALLSSSGASRSIVIGAGVVDRTVEITVADSGPGIADEVRSRIFEPFVTTKADGMGMGLAISRSIVEAQGGRLRLVATGEGGTRFAFDLPIAEKAFASLG
jgi:two-component system, LuxR family, sensor kinase FixL